MFYLKAVWLLELLGPKMLLNYFKSLYHANVAETFVDVSERRVYTFGGALRSTYIFRPMYFSQLITAWQLEVQGQLLPCTQTPAWVVSATVASILSCYVL